MPGKVGGDRAMRTVSIRDVSGRLILEAAERGEPLWITSDRVLCGVLQPVTPEWVNQLIERNLPRVLSSIKDGEEQLADRKGVQTLEELAHEARSSFVPPKDGAPAAFPRVSIRDLSAKLIERAATTRQPLAVTNGRVLCGMLIPISSQWVNQVIERNLPRALSSVKEGEEQLAIRKGVQTIEELFPAEVTLEARSSAAWPQGEWEAEARATEEAQEQ
jgi:antitoxin (DNA-binding transcriptional repressor) of toxin-antitoxin stability system